MVGRFPTGKKPRKRKRSFPRSRQSSCGEPTTHASSCQRLDGSSTHRISCPLKEGILEEMEKKESIDAENNCEDYNGYDDGQKIWGNDCHDCS